MLGLSVDQWNIVNGWANWLSALSTIAAVIFSLYVANRAGRREAKLTVGVRLLAISGAENHAEMIHFHLVNLGDKSFYVTAIGWYFGKKKKRSHFMQMYDRTLSSPLPAAVQPGEAANWCFQSGEGDWFIKMAESLGADWKSNIRTLRAIASTTTGEDFVCTPEPPLIDKLSEACRVRKSRVKLG